MNAPAGQRASLTRVAGAVIRVVVGVALVAWLARSGAIDWSALRSLAQSWKLMAIAEALLLAAFVVTAARLILLTAPVGLRLTLGDSLQLSLVGTFFNLVLPGGGGGDVVRIWFATHGNAGRRAEVVAVLLLDRFVGMFALVLWPLLALPFAGSIRAIPVVQTLAAAAAAAIVAMLAVFALIFSDRLRASAMVRWIFEKLPLGGVIERMVDTVRTYRSRPGALVSSTVVSLLAHTLSIGVTVVVASIALGDQFDWSVSVLIPLGFLVNTLPLTPGGLGVGEAAFDQLFRLAGLSNGAIVLIGWRLLSLVPAAIGLVIYLRGRRQFVATHD